MGVFRTFNFVKIGRYQKNVHDSGIYIHSYIVCSYIANKYILKKSQITK
jgi:hypothetical protein